MQVGSDALPAPDLASGASSTTHPDSPEIAAKSPPVTPRKQTELRSFKQALKIHYPGVLWSLLFSSAIIMEGYDTSLLASFYALPQFARKYGSQLQDGAFDVPPHWKAILNNSAFATQILGLLASGYLSEIYGRKKTMVLANAVMIAAIFLLFFAPNVEILLIGYVVCGIPWGIFQSLTTTYASEVAPIELRASVLTFINLGWVIGQLISSGITRGFLSLPNEWAYRIVS